MGVFCLKTALKGSEQVFTPRLPINLKAPLTHDSALGNSPTGNVVNLRNNRIFFLDIVGEHLCEIPLSGEMGEAQKGRRPATGSRGRSIKL